MQLGAELPEQFVADHKRVQKRPLKQHFAQRTLVVQLEHERLGEFEHVEGQFVVLKHADALDCVESDRLIRNVRIQKRQRLFSLQRRPGAQHNVGFLNLLRVAPID